MHSPTLVFGSLLSREHLKMFKAESGIPIVCSFFKSLGWEMQSDVFYVNEYTWIKFN